MTREEVLEVIHPERFGQGMPFRNLPAEIAVILNESREVAGKLCSLTQRPRAGPEKSPVSIWEFSPQGTALVAAVGPR